ncbi:MAG: hypothetical protein GY712_15030, partial [Oceanicoccus sp.]|uniref:RHS repeat-associated core domain-containing protein n=1 Tax=Oceanicoccus sp. TaxID=2691044 RepID=UPI00262F98E6
AIIDEFTDSGATLLAHYNYADRLLSLNTPTSEQYYHYSALRTTTNLTDESGATRISYHTNPWGEITEQQGTSVNRQVFTGQEHDENTGLVYFGARYYDPDTARFITQDSYLGQPGTPPSLHRYFYAYGNPTRFVDLYGYCNLGPYPGDSLATCAWEWITGSVSEGADKVVDHSIEKTQEQGDFIDTGGPTPTLNPWHVIGFGAQVVKDNPDIVLGVPPAAKPLIKWRNISKRRNTASRAASSTKSTPKIEVEDPSGQNTGFSQAAEASVETARASGKGYGKRGAAGALEVTDEVAAVTGRKYYQTGSKDNLQNHPVVDEAYSNVPPTQRAGGSHGKCAEASGCTQILNDYQKATGTKINTVNEARKILQGTKSDIRDTSNKAPKNPKPACSSCEPTIKELGVEDVNK